MEEEEEEEEGSPRPPRTKRRTPDIYPEPSSKPPKALRDMIDRLGDLPDVHLGDILLMNFSVRDIAWACRTSKRVASVCDTVEFWRALYYGDRALDVPLDELREFVRSSQLSLAELKNLYKWEDTVDFLKERDPRRQWGSIEVVLGHRKTLLQVNDFTVAIRKEDDLPGTGTVAVGVILAYDRIRMPGIDEDYLELPLEHPVLSVSYPSTPLIGFTVRIELSYGPREFRWTEEERNEYLAGIWERATVVTTRQLNTISDTGASYWSLESDRIARWDASRKGAVIRSFRYRIRYAADIYSVRHRWAMNTEVSSIYLESPFDSVRRVRHYEFGDTYRRYLYWKNLEKMHLSDPGIHPPPLEVFETEWALYKKVEPEFTNLYYKPEEDVPFVPNYPSVEEHQLSRRRWVWTFLPPGSADPGGSMDIEVEIGKMEIGAGEEEARALLMVEGQPSERYRLVSPPASRNPVPSARRYVSIRDGGSPLCRRGHELPEDLAIAWFEWDWVGPDLYCPVCGPTDGR